MKGQRIVFFDLETGGLDPTRHPIIQIAALVVDEDWREIETFQALIQFPERAAEAAALNVNHYDRDRWASEAKPSRTVMADFKTLLKRHSTLELRGSKPPHNPYKVAQLAGHNAASFDGQFLRQWFKGANEFLPADPRVLDTMQLAAWASRILGEPMKSQKLADCCDAWGVELSRDAAHDALVDVRATAALAKAISQRVGK